MGESGSGKTTLGLAALRLQASEENCFYWINKRRKIKISGHSARKCKLFSGSFGSLSPRMSMAEIIGEGLRVLRFKQTGPRQEVSKRKIERMHKGSWLGFVNAK